MSYRVQTEAWGGLGLVENKDETQKKIWELEAELKRLKESQRSKGNPLAWKRVDKNADFEDRAYYSVNEFLGTSKHYDGTQWQERSAEAHFYNGNYKQTQAQARRHAEHARTMLRLLSIADELNEGWRPDFSDALQKKIFISYKGSDTDVFVPYESINDFPSCCIYFKTKGLAMEAIGRLDERDKAVLRGEV